VPLRGNTLTVLPFFIAFRAFSVYILQIEVEPAFYLILKRHVLPAGQENRSRNEFTDAQTK